ncbi:MAG: MiaB/RimO family radical SAM methylthiotransferase, partial [Acidaminococcaceae bacterium]|nr:MiaB/RimO family radical SAM methylthiotransferase [Acidaminococcaceae bacterium]
MKKIAFYTLGCKVNQADTASMEEMFRKAGYQIVPFDEQSDVYLINTCVVTNTGQRKSKQIINRAVRKNPSALTVVTGCYPQTAADEVKKIDGVDIIIGNQERSSVVKLVEQAMDDKRTQILDNVQSMTVSTKFEELAAGLVTDRTRAFLKIQEGCNQYCSFCIIPYARGPLRSRSLAGIKEEASKLAAAGYKEIVLLGIHLGCYGKESGGAVSLCDAVEAVLEVEGISRIRLGSLESVEVDTRLLELMAKEPRICRHLHLPLQSGSD